MCGIICAFNVNNKKQKAEKVNDFIIDQYQNQYSRGAQGFGIVRVTEDKKVEVDRACEPTKFLLDLYKKESKMIIAHHRYPTSTKNKLDQTHPIFVSNKLLKNEYLVIHNGIISNDTELKKKHEELGFKYTTAYEEEAYNYTKTKFNDSESLAIELALFIENKITAIGIDNSAAFVVLQIDPKTKLARKVFFGRNGYSSCLNMSKTKTKLRLSSEGEGEEIVANKIYSFEVKTDAIKFKIKDIKFIKPKPPETPKPTTTAEKTTEELKSPFKLTELPLTQKLGNSTAVTQETTVVQTPAYEGNGNYSYNDKNYLSERAKAIKDRLKDEDTVGISHIIDDELDEEIDKAFDLINDYKNSLIEDQNNNSLTYKTFFTEQITRVLQAMQVMTAIAAKKYEEKEIEEEAEVDDYNASYGIPRKSPMGFQLESDMDDNYPEGYHRNFHTHG